MQADTFNLIFDTIEILAGLYIVYNAIRMKSTGTLSGNNLISKSIDLRKIRDAAGFINAMYLPYILSGTVFFLLGLVSLYFDMNGGINSTMGLIFTAILLADLIFLGTVTNKMQDKYLK